MEDKKIFRNKDGFFSKDGFFGAEELKPEDLENVAGGTALRDKMTPDEKAKMDSLIAEFSRLWELEANDPSYKSATDAAQKAMYEYGDYLERKYAE